MELSREQLIELQKKELEAFKQFLSICEKLKLKYYLLGGTLLGAIRHQGFIPWDDDIDVGMPRKDYEIFVTEGQKYMGSQYFIQTHISDPEYSMNFAKIRINNTTYIETVVASRKMHHGVYIDVFPLDIYPDKDKLFMLKKHILDLRISASYEGLKISTKAKIFQYLSKCFYPTLRGAVVARERHFKSVKQGKNIANFSGAWGKKEIVPMDWYGDGIIQTFEGLDVIVPNEYQKWLEQVYGDYMQLPPKEKRKSHHCIIAMNVHQSYKEFV